ncbi:protoglobin domain-containing protein [Granulicella sp. L60]|uniref:protoglobin domain-containing protein n=1 Tax=Granulicella sp. L60 TaxID=1641866 RepID=UPI00131C1085|nr:protoglobin domain-containing protein [Granulicella sp. L60]
MSNDIPGYNYGDREVARSPLSDEELEQLKSGAGFTEEDVHHLQMAGEVLRDQTEEIVRRWRSDIIAHIPHLAKHSRALDGGLLPDYLAKSNKRFEQWILDTCFRPYDRTWLDYQHEIGLRHTVARKNQVDRVSSTPEVPFRDVLSFIPVINETMKKYLAKKDHPAEDVEKMYRSWSKSTLLQMAIWTKAYESNESTKNV